MKLTRILLSICCAAAVLTACSKADNKAKVAKTHPVTITVDLDNALTKTTLSYDSENHKWIQNWKDGDAISFIYADESNNTVNEKFVLVSGAGTKTGVFHCDASSIPTSGTTYVLGIYPYSNLTHFSWIEFDYQNQGDGSKDNLGKYIIMYSQMKFIDGNFDSFTYSPEYVSFILKLPQGLQLVKDASGEQTISITMSDDGTNLRNCNSWRGETLQGTSDKGSILLSGVKLNNGALDSDTFIAATSGSGFKTFKLTVSDGVNTIDYVLERTNSLNSGNLYVINQDKIDPKSF